MKTCFVMQPFDQGVFDQRYEDVIKPAINDAGLEAYRVDQDPKVSIPIKEIENGIREATICLAEITVDNPNVWFELGYAIACRKQVVLICSEERSCLPNHSSMLFLFFLTINFSNYSVSVPRPEARIIFSLEKG